MRGPGDRATATDRRNLPKHSRPSAPRPALTQLPARPNPFPKPSNNNYPYPVPTDR